MSSYINISGSYTFIYTPEYYEDVSESNISFISNNETFEGMFYNNTSKELYYYKTLVWSAANGWESDAYRTFEINSGASGYSANESFVTGFLSNRTIPTDYLGEFSYNGETSYFSLGQTWRDYCDSELFNIFGFGGHSDGEHVSANSSMLLDSNYTPVLLSDSIINGEEYITNSGGEEDEPEYYFFYFNESEVKMPKYYSTWEEVYEFDASFSGQDFWFDEQGLVRTPGSGYVVHYEDLLYASTGVNKSDQIQHGSSYAQSDTIYEHYFFFWDMPRSMELNDVWYDYVTRTGEFEFDENGYVVNNNGATYVTHGSDAVHKSHKIEQGYFYYDRDTDVDFPPPDPDWREPEPDPEEPDPEEPEPDTYIEYYINDTPYTCIDSSTWMSENYATDERGYVMVGTSYLIDASTQTVGMYKDYKIEEYHSYYTTDKESIKYWPKHDPYKFYYQDHAYGFDNTTLTWDQYVRSKNQFGFYNNKYLSTYYDSSSFIVSASDYNTAISRYSKIIADESYYDNSDYESITFLDINAPLTFNIGPEARLSTAHIAPEAFYITNGSKNEYNLYITDNDSNLHKVSSLKWKTYEN